MQHERLNLYLLHLVYKNYLYLNDLRTITLILCDCVITLICCKICIVCLKKTENKRKEADDGSFFKKRIRVVWPVVMV